jgi:hypothetical protein
MEENEGVALTENRVFKIIVPHNILPRSCPRQRLRYEKETCPPDSFRLLRVEMLYGGKIFTNHDFRKEEVSEQERIRG